MTDSPTWLAYVEAMVAKAQAHQDELYYRLSLPGWQAELQRLRGGDAQAPETPDIQQLTTQEKPS